MTDLTPLTALGADTARSETFGALSVTENADLALASLTLRKGQDAPTPFGLTLPQAGGVVSGDGVSAFWSAPDQWMIEAPGQGAADFAAQVKSQAPGCSVTEQTDGFTVFEITSQAGAAPIEALMEKLVNIDPAALPPGCATRTGLHHMTVFLVRRAEDRLAVIGMRSFALSLWHALSTAAHRLES